MSIIRRFSLYTQQWYMSYSLRAGSGRTSWSCSQAVSKPVWHIPLLFVQWKTPDDGQRNCLKHADFYSKNRLEELVHLVGFIIRIYHDARSPERQITYLLTIWNRVLLEKLTGFQLVKKFPAFYGNGRFIIAFTSACVLFVPWVTSIQSMPPHLTSWRSILILSSNLRLLLPSWSLFLGFPHQNPVCNCPLLRSYRSISPGPRTLWTVRNMIGFHGEELLAPRPTPQLEDHLLSAVHDWSGIFSSISSILEAVPPPATWGCAMPC